MKQQMMYIQKLRSTKDNCNYSITNAKYRIEMNEYSTLPKIMLLLCEKVIGVFRTSQLKKWPPNNLRGIEIGQSSFNDLYHLTYQHRIF